MFIPKSRDNKPYYEWRRKVFDRDDNKCVKCGSKDKLDPHHIIEWDDAPELRLDVDNGMTLCRKCHMKHHAEDRKNLDRTGKEPWNKGLKGLNIGWVKGKEFSPAHLKKLSQARRGRAPWNKGLKMRTSTKDLQRKLYEGKTWIIDPETKKRIWIDN